MANSSGSSKSRGKRRALRVILALAALAAASVGTDGFLNASPETPVRAHAMVAVAASVVLYISYWRVSIKVHKSQHVHVAGMPFEVDKTQVADAASDIAQSMPLGEATYFVDVLATPNLVLERITESAEPLIRSVVVTTGVVVRKPRFDAGSLIVLPLLMVNRGYLVDGLLLQDAQGNRIASLSHIAAVTYGIAAFRRLISVLGPSAIDRYTLELQPRIVDVLSADTPVDEVLVANLTEELKKLCGLRWEAIAARLSAALVELRPSYPIACYLPISHFDHQPAVRLSVKRRVIPNLNRRTPKPAGLLEGISTLVVRAENLFRAFLGIRSSAVAFPLNNADRASSYHVELRGPEGTFLARQRVVDRATRRDANLSKQQYRMQSRRGQRLAHLYVRNGSGFYERYFKATFFERMPGSVGPAALSALAAAALISLATWVNLIQTGADGTDLVAVLLAFPAIASAWAGFGQSASLLRGTLAARVISALTIGLSIAASFLHILTPAVAPGGPILERPYARPWLIVLVTSGLNALVATGSWLMRGLVEGYFVGRTSEEGVDNG